MAGRQIAEAQIADAGANEPFHFVTNRFKHASNLAIDPLTQENAHAGGGDRVKTRDLGALAIQKYSARQLAGELRIPWAIEDDVVFLVDFEAGMGQPLREVAIIR
jgi:hypothetical protein